MRAELKDGMRLHSLLLCLLTGVALVLASGQVVSAPADQATDDLDVQVGKTVEISSSHRFCWFPSIHRFSTGEIMVCMQHSPDEVNPEGDFSSYCLSRDGGQTWSRRYTMGAGCSADGAYSTVAMPDGMIWHLYSYPEPFPDGQAQTFHDTLTKFGRGGRLVSQDRDIVIKLSQPSYMAPAVTFDRQVRDAAVETEIRGMPWGSILDGPGGELLCFMYYVAQADTQYYPKEECYRSVLLRSTDNGQTWTELSTIAAVPHDHKPAWMGSEGPNEGSVVRLSAHQLYAIFRTGGDAEIGNVWSSDDGKTWTEPVPIGFKGVAPRLHRLSDGMLALSTGRPGPVVLRFNEDGKGKKWSHETTLFTGMSTRYTDLLEIEPGKLLVVYDNVPYGWHEIPWSDREAKNRVYGTFVEYHRK